MGYSSRDDAYIESIRRKDKKYNVHLVLLSSFDEITNTYYPSSSTNDEILIKSLSIDGHPTRAMNFSNSLWLSLREGKYSLEISFEVNRSLSRRKNYEISKKRYHYLEPGMLEKTCKYKGSKKASISVTSTGECFVLFKSWIKTHWVSRTDSLGYTYWLLRDYSHDYELIQTNETAIKRMASFMELGRKYAYPAVDNNVLNDLLADQAIERARVGRIEAAKKQASASRVTSTVSAKPVFKEVKYSNGIYRGQVLNGKREGEGMFKWNSGDMYMGDWHDDKCHGHGIYYYKNGDKFVGEFVKGFRSGPGVYTWKDGSVRRGVWRDGKFVG